VNVILFSFRFVYGYASYNDLVNGASGANARGEEHEVEVKWSFASGRRYVYVDGNEMHSSVLLRFEAAKSKFELKFKMKDRNHAVHIICRAAAPRKHMNGYQPPQYDLIFINNENGYSKSFFDLPDIYELDRDVDSVYATVCPGTGEGEASSAETAPSSTKTTVERRSTFHQSPPPEQNLLTMAPKPQSMRAPSLVSMSDSSPSTLSHSINNISFSSSTLDEESPERSYSRPNIYSRGSMAQHGVAQVQVHSQTHGRVQSQARSQQSGTVQMQGHPQQHFAVQMHAPPQQQDPFMPRAPAPPTKEQLLHKSSQSILDLYTN
jgi:hypothetical protein